jgi:hypothetical protein
MVPKCVISVNSRDRARYINVFLTYLTLELKLSSSAFCYLEVGTGENSWFGLTDETRFALEPISLENL